jgi:hypothetical protein
MHLIHHRRKEDGAEHKSIQIAANLGFSSAAILQGFLLSCVLIDYVHCYGTWLMLIKLFRRSGHNAILADAWLHSGRVIDYVAHWNVR